MGITVILVAFVLYIIIRTRCTPACRHGVYVRVRRAVKSLVPSCLRRRRCSEEDDVEYRRQFPICVETTEQCLRRTELELIEVIDDQKTPCSDCHSDQPVCDDVIAST